MVRIPTEQAAAWVAGGLDRPPPLSGDPVQSDEALAAYYAHRAPEMEEAYAVPQRHADLQRLGKVLRDFAHGQDVLEIACGTGYWTRVMAATAHSITATDINEEMLALARSKACPSSRVNFLRDDAWTLKGVRGQFTVGVALFWWSHMPRSKVRPFLMTFHRALQPAGRVLFVDNLQEDCRWTPPVRIDAEGNTYQRRLLRTGEAFDIIKNYPSQAELRAAISELAEDARYGALDCVWVLTYRVRSESTSFRAVPRFQ